MLNAVGILSPGDMGHTVGNVLRQNGLRVITCLQGRSQRTRQLAEKAGIVDVPTYPEFVTEADLILSIMVPAQAMSAAAAVAGGTATGGQNISLCRLQRHRTTDGAQIRRHYHHCRWNFCGCVHHRSTTAHTRGDALLCLGTAA